MVYLPFRAEAPAAVTLIVRGSGGPARVVSAARDAANAIDPDLALGVVRTLDELRDRSRAASTGMASQFAKIGGLALVLSGVGLYSAMAYAVRRRTQEIAVRMALGAQATHVRWLFLRTGAWVVGWRARARRARLTGCRSPAAEQCGAHRRARPRDAHRDGRRSSSTVALVASSSRHGARRASSRPPHCGSSRGSPSRRERQASSPAGSCRFRFNLGTDATVRRLRRIHDPAGAGGSSGCAGNADGAGRRPPDARTDCRARARGKVPAVVLESGGGGPSLAGWNLIVADIATAAPVVAYDRAGYGRSEPDGEPPTPRHNAEKLHRLLTQLLLKPPYVLVGHSWGGPLIRMFAALYPGEVAGMIYLDPTDLHSRAQEIEHLRAIGYTRTARPPMSGATAQDFAAYIATLPPVVQVEMKLIDGIERSDAPEFQRMPPLPSVPISIVLAGKRESWIWEGRPCEPEVCYERRLDFAGSGSSVGSPTPTRARLRSMP